MLLQAFVRSVLQERASIESNLKFYHGTTADMHVGQIVRAKQQHGKHIGLGPAIERFMEKRKPANMLSRTNALFMVTRPSYIEAAGGTDDRVYEVEPIGRVERHHQGWLNPIVYVPYITRRNNPEEYAEAAAAADSYWAGDAMPDDDFPIWEYMTRAFKVVRVHRRRR